MRRWISVKLTALALGAIHVYQAYSRTTPPCCRFYPSCSHYAKEALQTHGVGVGLKLTVQRLLRCHPWGKWCSGWLYPLLGIPTDAPSDGVDLVPRPR
ncbi:MAG: membrane protein insertion efficiency factor YidD [Vampirovibrionales bacterium]